MRHHSPRSGLFRRWLTTTTALAGVLPVLALTSPAAHANPEGGSVVQGAATITQTNPKTVTVNQTTDKAVINWQSFSIGADETTRFNQPSSSSTTLNRVTGDQVSKILGNLSANGKVFLVNPNGIVFGAGSKIDVAALVASTADIKNENFMAGNLRFDIPGKVGAEIINQGTITAADGGLVALVSPVLRNSGIIQARLGKVALASANGVTLDLYGDNLILFQAADKITQQMVDTDGKPVSTAIENSGQIYADGGRVLMTANTAKGVVDNAINTTGLVSARAVEQQGGEIVLKGEDGGAIQVSGTLDASGKDAGQTGGRVVVTGQMVALVGNATLDASGFSGGGRILVGGDHMGGNLTAYEAQAKGLVLEEQPIKTAEDVRIGSGVSLDASALYAGNGGKISVWADNSTEFYGAAKATGGPNGGNGGVVEISGGRRVVSQGKVNVTAKKGQAGRYLIDPAGSLYASTNDFLTELDGGTVAYVSDIYTDTDGSIYILSTKNVSQSDYRVDPDGSRTYKTNLILTKISGGAIVAQSVIDTIYAGNAQGYGAQRGTLQVTSSGIKVFNSEKTSANNYGQDGFIYTISKDTLDATTARQTLFSSANWGWAPYFDSSGNVHHFSFAGYYSVTNTSGGSFIMPDTFYRQMFAFRLNRADASGDASTISELQLSQALLTKAKGVVAGQANSSGESSTSTDSDSSDSKTPSNNDMNGDPSEVPSTPPTVPGNIVEAIASENPGSAVARYLEKKGIDAATGALVGSVFDSLVAIQDAQTLKKFFNVEYIRIIQNKLAGELGKPNNIEKIKSMSAKIATDSANGMLTDMVAAIISDIIISELHDIINPQGIIAETAFTSTTNISSIIAKNLVLAKGNALLFNTGVTKDLSTLAITQSVEAFKKAMELDDAEASVNASLLMRYAMDVNAQQLALGYIEAAKSVSSGSLGDIDSINSKSNTLIFNSMKDINDLSEEYVAYYADRGKNPILGNPYSHLSASDVRDVIRATMEIKALVDSGEPAALIYEGKTTAVGNVIYSLISSTENIDWSLDDNKMKTERASMALSMMATFAEDVNKNAGYGIDLERTLKEYM